MRVEDADGVRTITFDRPDRRNAMTLDLARELAGHLESLDPADHDAAVLTGEGAAFSAGGDVQAMAEREWTARESYDAIRSTFGRVAEAALSSVVPLVAKVNGDAVGAGLSLVAVSDFAYAADSARFGAAFVRVGLVPDTGGTFLLPRLVGMRAAKDLAFTGRLVDAAEAADLGLVNRVVPDDDLDDAVDELLATLRKRPTRTIGLIKQGFHRNAGVEWRDALDYECLLQSQAYDTDEHAEGVAAFLEKRDSVFE